MNIKKRDGLIIECLDMKISVDCDIHNDSNIGIISHAHADHLPLNSTEKDEYLCSKRTHSLASRRSVNFNFSTQMDNIIMFDAGHIIGSKSFLIEGDKDILYTGDFSLRDRMHISGFEPPSADVLIIESTYGHPRYNFEDQNVLESKIIEWFKKNIDERLVCKGYSLGRAQEIEILAKEAGFDNILVNKATKNMNECFSDEYNFSTDIYEDELPDKSVLITSNKKQIENFSEEDDVKTAIFTGWAHDNRYENNKTYDESFVLTDHSDFEELIKTVNQVEPEKVYTVHGYKDRLANEIQKRLGIQSQSLKNNQREITDWN